MHANGISDGVRVTSLANGLTVILQEIEYSPVAAVSVAYRVGPLWETDGTRGLSHFCEHMMFKGSEKYGPGKYWQMIQRKGGYANAYTSRDITVYYSVIPSIGLDDVLQLEADRMINCLMAPREVASEKKVILEEELLTGRDSPEGALDNSLFGTAFTVHPYGHPITGDQNDISRFSSEGLTSFYRNFYNPSNATIAVAGRIDCAKVLTRITELFGEAEGRDVRRPSIRPEPDQRSVRRIEIQHPSGLPRISMGFRVPPANHVDSAALSILSIYLSSGRSSRFEELLVKPGIVLEVAVSTNTLVRQGLYTLQAVLLNDGSTEHVEKVIFGELERIAREGIEDSELLALKERRRSWSVISDADPPGRSRRLATGKCRFDDPFYFWSSIEKSDHVTSAEIQAVISKYLYLDNASVATLNPTQEGNFAAVPSGDLPAAEQDLVPPSSLRPDDIDIPERLLEVPEVSVADNTREIIMDNGLRILLKSDSSFPVLSIGFSCPMGAEREPEGLTGLSEMTAETMLYGTPEEDSIVFNGRLERLGSSIDFSSTHEYSGGIITVLKNHAEEALSTISQLLMNPAFRQEDLESVRRDALTSLEEWTSTPMGAAMNSFSRLSTYPPEKSTVPTKESLSAITRKHLCDFHREFCRPGGSVITAVGSFNEEELIHLLRRYFDAWEDPETPLLPPTTAGNPENSAKEAIPLNGREQIAVVLGTPAPARLADDSYAASLLNGILGDGIGSRLGRSIRETGLTYHVGSVYLPFSSRGRIAVILLTSPPAFPEAMRKLKAELTLLSDEPVSESELRLEKASYIGRQELGMMKYSSIARTLLTYASLKLPLDQDRRSLQRISKLTAEDLHLAAKRWIGGGITYLSIAGAVEGEPREDH